MGLDFGVYAKKQGEEPIELAYGRKSWELVYALVPDYDDFINDDPTITIERWDALMEKLNKIGPKLDEIYNAYHELDNWPDDWVNRENMTPKMRDLFDKNCDLCFEYEIWYNRNFDTSPTLGYDFSVGYMLNFWEADKEVRKYLEDPEYEVKAYVSY